MRTRLFVLIIGLILGVSGAHLLSRPPRDMTSTDVEAAITDQFKQQWNEKKDTGDNRSIKKVRLGKIYASPGSDNAYTEIWVYWNDVTSITSTPIVHLTNSAFAVSYEVPNTKQNLNAVVSVK